MPQATSRHCLVNTKLFLREGLKMRVFIGQAVAACMHTRMKKGQGALEYLLLIGGAILIAVVILSLLATGIVPTGNQQVQNNVQTYNEELCLKSGLYSAAQCAALDAGIPGDFRNFNLSYSSASPNNITLSWIWPGDDGLFQGGAIAGYELRYSTNPITSSSFPTDTDIFPGLTSTPLPTPGPAGSVGSISFTLPAPGYWFGIRAYDDAIPVNYSANVVTNHYP
jgi:type II secretory pathway pseudopilin PulG